MKNKVTRSEFHYFKPILTRWIDNDVYGHINNALYYTYFDTVVNTFLIERGGLDIANSPVVGFIVSSTCNYHAPLAFPDAIDAGMKINRIGNSSVEYGVAVFKQGEDTAAASGTFTHVFVQRETSQSTSIPTTTREAFEQLARSD